MKIKYDMELMGFMKIFQQITRARLKDCLVDENSLLTFIVEQDEIGKAVGKKASNVMVLERAFKRKIKIAEFNNEVTGFVKSLIYPLKALDIQDEDGVITITPQDSKTRGYLIGRAASNLRNLESITKRYFQIKEIKVI